MKKSKTSGKTKKPKQTGAIPVTEDDQQMEDVTKTSGRKRKACQPSKANTVRHRSIGMSESEFESLRAIRDACGFSSWRQVLQHVISLWVSSQSQNDQDFSTPVHTNTEVSDTVASKKCKISDSPSMLEKEVKTAAPVEGEIGKILAEIGRQDQQQERRQGFQMAPLCFLNPKVTAQLEEIRLEHNAKHWLEVIERLVVMWNEHRIQKMSLNLASRLSSTDQKQFSNTPVTETDTREKTAIPRKGRDVVSKRRKLFEEVAETDCTKKSKLETVPCLRVGVQADDTNIWKEVNFVCSTDHHREQRQPMHLGSDCLLTPEQTAHLEEIHRATNSSSWREVIDHLINLWKEERVRRVALAIAGGALSTPDEKYAGSFVLPLGEEASSKLDDEAPVEAFKSPRRQVAEAFKRPHRQVEPKQKGQKPSEPVDGNESWDDGCSAAEDVGEKSEPAHPLSMKGPGGQEIKYAAPLLSKNYHLKFSAEARQKRCSREGDDRTVAQMANSRRLLVERRQLIELMSLVRCSKAGCGELLDQSTMKCLVSGYACNFKAVCCGRRHHCFEWATSSRVWYDTAKKNKVATYTLNVVTPAAVILSGNGPTRMKSFADALNLQWSDKTQQARVQRTCVIPAIEKCTKMAQEEMFQNLRRQEGRIVLAGDGQFDSPGSCANSCTYSLAVAGIERDNGEDKEFYLSGYVVSQGIAERRHADDKSPAMEHIALHTALRPLYNSNVTVHELVTDGHSQVTASFKKVSAASKEKDDNLRTGKNSSEKMDQFIKMLQHHNLLTCSAKDAVGIHSFYAQISHSVDTWHEGKSIRKRIKKISASAPIAERASYQSFAGYFQKHLWYCSEKAKGDPEEFKERWLILLNHVQGDHRKCEHSGVSKKDGVSSKTTAFGTLKKFITDMAKKADQLCRFRHTGALESFHNVSLIYASKRIFYDYDVMVMKKRLAVLHYNHNVNRPWKYRENREIMFSQRWSKASKTHIPTFVREEANFDYIGHLMAAVLYERVTGECDFIGRWGTRKVSPQHPRHIRRSCAPYAQLPSETFRKWKTRYPAYRKVATARSTDVSDGEDGNEEDNASTDDHGGDEEY